MNTEKNNGCIRLNGNIYEVNFCNITDRKDGNYNVNFYIYSGITKNRGLLKDMLHYYTSLSTLNTACLRGGMQLDLVESVENINIFEVKYITKSDLETYKPIDFENFFNDKVVKHETN